MSASPAKFVWYELLTTDTAAAAAFYERVNLWSAAEAGVTGTSYTVFSAAGTGVAGMMELPADVAAMGARPSWIGYVAVDDVDAAADRLAAAGGTIKRPGTDIPTVGRFAVVADPQGATFVLFRPAMQGGGAPPAGNTPGHVAWHELHAAELDSAFAFYAGQFGWTKGVPHDMGPMGIYQIFATGAGDAGGMMTKTAMFPVPLWLYYFFVADIDAAVARVSEAGGQVLNGPQLVPGGAWIAQCLDPQGALFALVGPRPQQ